MVVYIVMRYGVERTVEKVFVNLEIANNYVDDMNDRHSELYARRKKDSRKIQFPGDIYEVHQFMVMGG